MTKILQNFSIPEQKGVIFVNPEFSKWHLLLSKNKDITKNVPHRQSVRNELLSIARNYTQNILGINCQNKTTENIIATGHQAIWHHCGIWAKNIAIYNSSQSIGGISLQLVLDHDVCNTAMILPQKDGKEKYGFKRIEIEKKRKQIPLEFRSPPDMADIRLFVNEVVKTNPFQLCEKIWAECNLIKESEYPHFNNVADIITLLQSMLNFYLGLNIIYLPISRLSQSDAFLDFVTSIILDSRRFVEIYNDGIKNQYNDVKSSRKTGIRRLNVDENTNAMDLPFWLVSPEGLRKKLVIKIDKKERITIGAESTRLGTLNGSSGNNISTQLKKLLKHKEYLLRPKAVTLTLFTRLYLADLFVHGIGGCTYAPVTDYIIKNYFNLNQINYVAATANMTLPLSNINNASSDRIKQLKHKLHDIKHNPEKYIRETMYGKEPVISLIKAKKKAIKQTKNSSISVNQKKSAWNSLSMLNKSLYSCAKDTVENLENEISTIQNNKISRDVCVYREFFFGLFPEKKLRELAETLN